MSFRRYIAFTGDRYQIDMGRPAAANTGSVAAFAFCGHFAVLYRNRPAHNINTGIAVASGSDPGRIPTAICFYLAAVFNSDGVHIGIFSASDACSAFITADSFHIPTVPDCNASYISTGACAVVVSSADTGCLGSAFASDCTDSVNLNIRDFPVASAADTGSTAFSLCCNRRLITGACDDNTIGVTVIAAADAGPAAFAICFEARTVFHGDMDFAAAVTVTSADAGSAVFALRYETARPAHGNGDRIVG